MKQLQLIYDELAERKEEKRRLDRQYKESLLDANEFTETDNKLKELRAKKKQIEILTQDRMGSAWDRREEIKGQIKDRKNMMTDVAMGDLVAGKTVLIRDKKDCEYEPVWSVKFKKIQ